MISSVLKVHNRKEVILKGSCRDNCYSLCITTVSADLKHDQYCRKTITPLTVGLKKHVFAFTNAYLSVCAKHHNILFQSSLKISSL